MSFGNERDELVLRTLARYGLLPAEALRRRYFAGKTKKACERLVTRLMAEGLVCSYRLNGNRKYYMLTADGARRIGVSDVAAGKPFAAQGLCQNLAMAAYCLLGTKQFERMTQEEFIARFPALARAAKLGRGSRTRYYLDTTDAKVRLALMVCDFGADTRRVAKKALDEVNRRIGASGEFAAMVHSQLFSVTILTSFQRKAVRIAEVLKSADFHHRVVVVPELGRFFLEE
jgi:hypothetical protein